MNQTPLVTPPYRPHYAERGRTLKWFMHEIWDHLWPWSPMGFRKQRFLIALSVAAAVGVAMIWVLGAVGRLGPPIILAWWVMWSVFEVLVRMQSKPYVKEGPWWRDRYRTANWMDMVCYVSFKNLLLAALLFLLMRLIGAMDYLQSMPALDWLYR